MSQKTSVWDSAGPSQSNKPLDGLCFHVISAVELVEPCRVASMTPQRIQNASVRNAYAWINGLTIEKTSECPSLPHVLMWLVLVEILLNRAAAVEMLCTVSIRF